MVENVLQDTFWLGTVLDLLRHPQDISCLPHEVLQVAVLAFVCQLGQPHLLLGELVVKVEQLEGRVGQFFQHW